MSAAIPRVKHRASAPRRFAVFVQLETEHGRGILRGVAQFFRQHPFVTVLKFNKRAEFEAEKLRQLDLDGIIAKVSSRRDEDVLHRLGLPAVNISGQFETSRLSTVNTDDDLVGRLAFRHLHSRGYRHFAYCGGRLHRASRHRWAGFRQEAAAQPTGSVQRMLLEREEQNGIYPESVRAELDRWLSALPKPVAVFAFTDRIALELEEACHRSGLSVPDQVAILGVGNDLTRLEFAQVDISSIQLNTQRIGALAAETLWQMATQRSRKRRELLVSPLKIVARRSTDRFAVADATVSDAIDYIREHVGNTIYVADIARFVGVSRRLLELKFRRAIGCSVYAEVQRRHFERAIELMADPELTLGEIAYAAGFPSAQVFSSSFRQRFGESPSSYRDRMIGVSPSNRRREPRDLARAAR
jgi:Transcriptional regulators